LAIAVFCELNGQSVLGKARELADETGDRVSAFCSLKDSEQQKKLIYLGADEVVVCPIVNWGEWVSIISQYLITHKDVKVILFPSSLLSNALMGAIYGEVISQISPFVESADVITSDGAGRKLEGSVVVEKNFLREKTALVSLQKAAVAEPFEDTSRFGKIRNFEEGLRVKIPLLPSELRSSSDQLTVLVGSDISSRTSQLASRLAEKYGGVVKPLSGKVEVIYGPCVAIEVASRLRELPEFKGELLSISSRKMSINAVAELSVINSEIDRVLENLSG
jgi:hypothetical protein